LGNFSTIKLGKKLISLGIILRVFLEQYRARKAVKFCLFQKAFENWQEVKGQMEQEKKIVAKAPEDKGPGPKESR
jgi:hypothetical protein